MLPESSLAWQKNVLSPAEVAQSTSTFVCKKSKPNNKILFCKLDEMLFSWVPGYMGVFDMINMPN